MGKDAFSRETYGAAVVRFAKEFTEGKGPATKRAEQKARETGKLNPLVDPAGYGVIRRSLPRFEKQGNGLWLLTIGTPMPKEDRLDTTGSMGGNVDIAISVLPKSYELCSIVLPDYDLQIATGIFGDVCDRFVLCRPQFEMTAEKIVEQLTLMVPERYGGDDPEDPHYGLFGAAYLTDRHINRVGLKGYDFTISDSWAHDLLDEAQLKRIFGDEVFDKAAENGHQIDRHNLPTTADVIQELLKFVHGFFLQVGDSPRTTEFWTRLFGKDRVVILPSTELLPQVQAAIIGLTEGTLNLQDVKQFLTENNVSNRDAGRITRSVANIPIGAQTVLPNFNKRPRKGDLFKEKTDIWPIDKSEASSLAEGSEDTSTDSVVRPKWL